MGSYLMRARVYITGLVAIAVISLAAIVLRSVRRAWAIVHPTRTHVWTEARRLALSEMPTLEDIALRTSDGLALRGWFAPGRNRAVIIFVHGLWGNRLSLLPEARVLANHGYGILVYDSRASGESDGNVATWGDREQLDVRAAVDFASSRPEIDPTRIALLGFSVGGSTAAMAMARDSRPRALILYATWTSFEDEMRHKNAGRLGSMSLATATLVTSLVGVRAENIRPIDCIGAISPRPLLMITGTLDNDTPVPIMEHLFAAARQPKELWVVAGADHGTYVATASAEYEARVVGFLDRALLDGAGSDLER